MTTPSRSENQQGSLLRTLTGFVIGISLIALVNRRPRKGRPEAEQGEDIPDLILLGAGLLASVAMFGLSRRSDSTSNRGLGNGAIHLREAITINRPADELYKFWRNFENLPRFMNHLHEVQRTGDNQSRWVASGPLGTRVQWTAEIINETPNELIAWRSLPGGDIDCAGTVRFQAAPGKRGTIVKVEMEYRPPAGKVGATVSRLLGVGADKQVAVDLRRLKQLIETGEIARTEGQSAGRPRSTSRTYDDIVRG
jgi:uncharacterized membrane protein